MSDLPSILQTPGSTDLLGAAEAAVRAYCGWHIAPSITETITVDGPGGTTIFLPTAHLTGVTSASNGGIALDPTTLEWSADGMVRLDTGWVDRFRGVTLTITHGFDAAPQVAAIIREVAARAEASPGGLVEARAGQVSEKRSLVAPGVAGGVVLMAHEREQLEPFKVRGF